MSNLFFKPRIGQNYEGRLVLLATAPCTHSANCPYFEKCTVEGQTADFNECCPYPDYSFEDESHKLKLEENVDFIVEKHIKDKYDECDEKRNTSLTRLTNVLGECFLNKKATNEDERRKVWENVMITELCQHFIPYGVNRKGNETLDSDFGISNDYGAFKEIISTYNIKKVLVLGKPSWTYLKTRMEKDSQVKLEHELNDAGKPDENGYLHYLTYNGTMITIIYSWHPSYPGFYDNGKLQTILRQCFV